MKKIIPFGVAILMLTACEKEIDIDLNSADPQLVIEAVITDEPGPHYVKLSRTANFSDPNTFDAVSGALVIISDNTGITDTLSELSPGYYQTSVIVGQTGNTYQLHIENAGKNYFATATMPTEVMLDSLRFNLLVFPGANNSFATVPVFTDPATTGNNYRFVQTVNGFTDPALNLFNDNVNNGIVNQRPVFTPNTPVETGDTVTLEMRCLDASTYLYYYTLSAIAGNGPGGGTTPSNPPNNITGDFALGQFSVYTSQRITTIVQ
jgi:hypothetical protein